MEAANRKQASRVAAREAPLELQRLSDVASLLEPAVTLMEAHQMSLAGVQDLQQRIACAHSRLLLEPSQRESREDVAVNKAAQPASAQSVAQLLASDAERARARLSTALPSLDAALGGGLCPGQLVEITASSTSLPTARRIVQRWARDALIATSTHTGHESGTANDAHDGAVVYWVSAEGGVVAQDAMTPLVRAVACDATAASHLYTLSVSDVETLERESITLIRDHSHHRRDGHSCFTQHRHGCLVVIDALSLLVRRSFPSLYDTQQQQSSAGSRDEVFALHAVVQRLAEQLKSFSEAHHAVCVLLTEQPEHVTAHQDGLLGRAFVHAMNMRLCVRDGLWCVRSRAPTASITVGLRTELQIIKSAVCAPFTMLVAMTMSKDEGALSLVEVDVLVSDTTCLTRSCTAVVLVEGMRTRATLLVAEAFLGSADGWDHTAPPRFLVTG